jgi:hypothetical protein
VVVHASLGDVNLMTRIFTLFGNKNWITREIVVVDLPFAVTREINLVAVLQILFEFAIQRADGPEVNLAALPHLHYNLRSVG